MPELGGCAGPACSAFINSRILCSSCFNDQIMDFREQKSSEARGGAAPLEPSLPPEIPDYDLPLRIGRGAYGEVWLGQNRVTGTRHAVKIVRADLGERGKIFEREYSGIRSYEPISRSDPSLMPILHVGRNDQAGLFYYVMELADDTNPSHSDAVEYAPRTLRHDLLVRDRLTVAECVEIALALASALSALHRCGLLHRDIKPSNIIFVHGRPKLADIGLVAGSDATVSLVGTEGYAAPEGPSSTRADLYSLGKVLYEASTGKDRKLFPEPLTTVASAGDESLWPELNEVILKACQPDPALRYESADALRKDLLLLEAGYSLRRLRQAERRIRVLSRVFAFAALAGLLAAAGFFYQRRQSARYQRLADENRANLVRIHVENGVLQMDDGDLTGSLPWFAEALRLDQGNPAREEVHRRRLEAVLQQTPKLIAIGAHAGPIHWSEFSRDGRRVVTASGDRSARVWDALTSAPVTPPMEHSDEVRHAAFSPDGTRVVTASDDQTARLWDASSGQKIAAMRHEGGVVQAVFSPDGGRILTASADGTARVWTAEGEPLFTIQHADPVECLAVSPDGNLLVTGTRGGIARIWNLESGAAVTEALLHQHWLRGVAFSSDGQLLATTSSDGTAIVWESRTGQRVAGPLRHNGTVWTAEFSADGKTLLTAAGKTSQSGEARLWRIPSGEPLGDGIFSKKNMRRASFSPDGRWILACGQEGTATIWDTKSLARVFPPFVQTKSVWQARFFPDGRRILLSGKDGTWRIWDLASDLFQTATLQHLAFSYSVAFSPEGNQVLIAATDPDARLWDIHAISHAGAKPLLSEFAAEGIFSQDGRWLATSGPHAISVFSRNNLTAPVRSFPPGELLQFSGDGSKLALWTELPREIRIENLASSSSVRHRIEPGLFPFACVFSHDGKWAAVGGGAFNRTGRGEARILSTQTGDYQSPPLSHPGSVSALAISIDDRYLVTAYGTEPAERCEVKVWKLPSGEPTGAVFPHADGVNALDLSPDGRWLVTACENGVAQVWEFASGKAVGKPLRHQRGFFTVHFSPDGRRVVTASVDRTARVWDAATGDPLSPPLRHDGAVSSAVFHPEGDRVLTTGWDQISRLWDLSSGRRQIAEYSLLAEMISGRRVTPAGNLLSIDGLDLAKNFVPQKASLDAAAPQTDASAVNWHSVQAHRAERLRDWRAAIFHLDQLSMLDPAGTQFAFRKSRAMAELAREQSSGARDSNNASRITEFYPLRDPKTPAGLIDLSSFYNAPLRGDWSYHAVDPRPLPLGPGMEKIDGTPFDLRGIVQLEDSSELADVYEFPREIRGIPIQGKGLRLHILHGVIGWRPRSGVIAYSFHYADGTRREALLKVGREIQEWMAHPPDGPLPPGATIAWQGQFPALGDRWHQATLYRLAWENPLPELEIDHIDIKASDCAPFVMGITLE